MHKNVLYDLLRSDIVLNSPTKLERRIKREALLHSYKVFGSRSNFDFTENDVITIKQVVALCTKLINSSAVTYNSCPRQLISGLSNCISNAYCSSGIVNMMVFASYAVGKGNIVDLALLSDRKQYLIFDSLGKLLQNTFNDYGLICQMNIILPDMHHEFPISEYNSAWEENARIIQNLTVYPVSRLSTQVDYKTISLELLNNKKRILRATDQRVIAQFGANIEKAVSSIEYYSSIGKWLENKGPNFIIADVQKKIYPYQQPFYNAYRAEPIGVIPYQNLIQDPR